MHPSKDEFEKIVKDNYKIIYNLGIRLLNNKTEVEDFMQEVFIQIYEKWSSYKKESKISTWIYSIALNLGLNKIKKNKKLKELIKSEENIEQVIAIQSSPEFSLIDEENNDFISSTLRKEIFNLPQKYRLPLFLYYYENLSYKEISNVLDVPEGTIKSLIYRGKIALREKIISLQNFIKQ